MILKMLVECQLTAICRTLGQFRKRKHESDHKPSTSDNQSRTMMGRHCPRVPPYYRALCSKIQPPMMSKKRRCRGGSPVIRWTYGSSLDVMQIVVAVDTFALEISVEDGHDGVSL
jgi:hypothetical protein